MSMYHPSFQSKLTHIPQASQQIKEAIELLEVEGDEGDEISMMG